MNKFLVSINAETKFLAYLDFSSSEQSNFDSRQLSSLLRLPPLRLTPTSLATVLAMPASAMLVMPAMEDLATLVTLPPMLPATLASPPLLP